MQLLFLILLLQAKLCVEGKDSLYAYCQENGVPCKKVGKLIVATQSQQVPLLENMQRAGEANGVHDLRLLEATDVRSMEPQLQCVKALWSPSSGILDTHSFMSTLEVWALINLIRIHSFLCDVDCVSIVPD